MLSDRYLSVGTLSCVTDPVLSVTLVYCGQTVGRIKMKLGMVVDRVPDHIVLDGNPASPQKGHSPLPNFQPMFVVAKRLDGLRCHLIWKQASAQAILC